MEVENDGISILVSDEHWLKAPFPAEVADDEIVTFVNEEHS